MKSAPADAPAAAVPSEEAGWRLPPNEFGPDTRTSSYTLKDEDVFAVFGASGDMNGQDSFATEPHSKDGLFWRDTRMLSRFALTLNDRPLSSMGVEEVDNLIYRCDLSNGRLFDDQGREFQPFQLHVRRERFISGGMVDWLTITNYGLSRADLTLSFHLHADFRDIFEIRGANRRLQGELFAPHLQEDGVRFRYRAADGLELSTVVALSRRPSVSGARLNVPVSIDQQETVSLTCDVRIEAAALPSRKRVAHAMLGRASDKVAGRIGRLDRIRSDRPAFDTWLYRSAADLALLTSDLQTGPYPYAGVPWFSAPFGRDALITAMQVLWLDPGIARGVLAYLAETQATVEDVAMDSDPGKILHEARSGEMARTGECPFGRYYGGADQTMLFVMLAGAYLERTDDTGSVRALLPAIRRALVWMQAYGDRDGDGFIEYQRRTPSGLRNQGWKDSEDAIFHQDGRLAEGPIALVEVQAYRAAALQAAATIFERLSTDDDAAHLREEARDLRERIDGAFWDEALGTYVLALDGAKQPARVRSSNAAHVLFAGAARDDRVSALAAHMGGGDMLTGYGLRTIDRREVRFNPMGYHTGSIWPHDNSLAAAGFARYGRHDMAARLTHALFEAATNFPLSRLPELFCGFERTPNGRPVAFPSACAPQAWAAGAPFLCLQACLGLQIDAARKSVTIGASVLPDGLHELTLSGIEVDGAFFDLTVTRAGGRTRPEIRRADPEISFRFANR